jgi:prephenate dehydrogenase
MRQITIIGTGLIGGSFALAVRKSGSVGRVVGCDRAAVLEKAQDLGAIDEGHIDAATAIAGSDVVLMATPVGAIIDLVQRIAPRLGNDVLLTDVGSTKAQVVEAVQRVLGERARQQFLAGHPMAGKEQSGIEHATADLFRDAVWFFTPLADQVVDSGARAEFMESVRKCGARPAMISAQEHDRLCAWISHTPQMLSTALAAALVDEFGEASLESGGRALREMTRISQSPYSMWRDIAITNQGNLAQALHKLEQHLAHIRENLGSRELAREFDQAHKLKLGEPRKQPD